MKPIKKIFLGALVFVAVAVLGAVYIFFTAKNRTVNLKVGNASFEVEVAETISQQAKGLSFRDGLDKNKGMLFDFDKESTTGFWMMGMKFPLDIIWIKNNVVVGIEKNVPVAETGTPEAALKVYYPPEAVDKVLEINAGLCDELGIKAGDAVSEE